MIKKHNQKSEIKEGVSKGIFSGFLASLCCVGPLIIVLLGLGSISFALSISQYKPYFLSLGILFMLGAIILHLNKKNKVCKINCFSVNGLKKEKKFIISLVVSMIIIYVLALYVLVPAVSPTVYESAAEKLSQKDTPTQITENSNLNVLDLKIDGMTCNGCASGIQSILQNLDGVVEVNVSYSGKNGRIIYDSNKISKENIMNSDAFTGPFSAEIIKDEN